LGFISKYWVTDTVDPWPLRWIIQIKVRTIRFFVQTSNFQKSTCRKL
jgi:hypothetical protein